MKHKQFIAQVASQLGDVYKPKHFSGLEKVEGGHVFKHDDVWIEISFIDGEWCYEDYFNSGQGSTLDEAIEEYANC